MDIRNKTVLVIGGWGLVGSAVCRQLMGEKPKRIIVTSLTESEAKEAVDLLKKQYPRAGRSFFIPWAGNIMLRHTLKDRSRDEILKDPKTRAMLIDDLLDELTPEVLERTSVFQLLSKYKPDIVIDCINTATAIAYQDLFQVSREVRKAINKQSTGGAEALIEVTERLLATQYIPQLIRHVQIMYKSMSFVGTKLYLKIGTSGTGGMGLNIPYTHSEEKPSSVLLSKSSVAGAQTLLLFLMGRTPDSPITKEVKPAAAIAWKRIGYGPIKKRGKTIEMVDCAPENGLKLQDTLSLTMEKPVWKSLNTPLKSVFIDTGENGTFSRSEFEAIATAGQMEYVTPEEIAEACIFEIKGGNTGHDIINALDNAAMAPTYRAGFIFENAVRELKKLEELHKTKSIAFEILGPPRLSKLLYEAHLLQLAVGSMDGVLCTTAKELSKNLEDILRTDADLRSRIISIGVPILMADGRTMLRGKDIKIPPYRGENELPLTERSVNQWARDGWVDLRVKNMDLWRSRILAIKKEVEAIPPEDTSSRNFRTRMYWDEFATIDPGKIVGWIFTVEEKGKRMKA
jgi:hypothetical protein